MATRLPTQVRIKHLCKKRQLSVFVFTIHSHKNTSFFTKGDKNGKSQQNNLKDFH